MRLSRLQRWMQSVVVHPGTTKQALRSRPAASLLPAAEIESVLLPSKTLKPAERIAIYQEMYPLRMRDALSSDYPALEHFLGDRYWDFVAAYTKRHPSMAHSLNRLGDHVPSFLSHQTKLKPRGFLKDLASLELAITEAFDAMGAATLQAREIEKLPPDQLVRSRLVTVPSLRLLSLSWNVAEYLDTIYDEKHRHPKPKRVRSYLVIVRRGYVVYRFPVSEAAFAVLSDLREGRTIGSVVQRALARRGARRASPDDFSTWFRSWTSDSVFARIGREKS